MRSRTRLEAGRRGLKVNPPVDESYWISCLLMDIKKKDDGVAVMSIVIELLVLLGKKMFIV